MYYDEVKGISLPVNEIHDVQSIRVPDPTNTKTMHVLVCKTWDSFFFFCTIPVIEKDNVNFRAEGRSIQCVQARDLRIVIACIFRLLRSDFGDLGLHLHYACSAGIYGVRGSKNLRGRKS